MGKKTQKERIQTNNKEEEDFDPSSIPKSRKNHKIGYDVRFQIVEQVMLDLEDFVTRPKISKHKVKESTLKAIKKQWLDDKEVTLFNRQRIRYKYELQVMNEVFRQQMTVVEQNKQYITALYHLFFKTDIPNLNDAEIMDKYNQSQRGIIAKYLKLYNFSSPKQANHLQNETKQEESFRNDSGRESFENST